MSWLLAAPDDIPTTARSRIVTAAMIVVTLGYLFIELAFNYTLVHTLGSADLEADRITPEAVSGMTEMGRRLTATAVALLFLGLFANNFVKDQLPFPLPTLAKLMRRWPARPWQWGFGTTGAVLVVLAGIWWTTHTLEDRAFELEAWIASAEERQNLHVALNATKMALAAASLAAKSPNVVRPLSLDVSDRCLAVPQPRRGSIPIDAAFLAQPGARPLIASLPHLLATRWAGDAVTIDEERCEIVRRWRSLLPGARESYDKLVAPAMRTLEQAYDPDAQFVTDGPGKFGETKLREWLAPSQLKLSGTGLSQEMVAACVGPRNRLSYPAAICLWRSAHDEAARQATEAGIRYRAAYLERRAAKVAELEGEIAAGETAAQVYPDDFAKMSEADRAGILPALRKEANRTECLAELDIVEQSIPASLDGIDGCKDLASKVNSLTRSAIEQRYRALGGAYGVVDWWNGRQSTSDAVQFKSEAERLCAGRAADEVAAKCRSAVLATAAERASEARAQLRAFPLDPREGMLEALAAGRNDRALGDPALWPADVQTRLRGAVNRLIAQALAPDRGLARRLALTEFDTLPTCDVPGGWLDSLLYDRIDDTERRSTASRKLADLAWCDAYRSAIRSAGARADEHAEALPKLRGEVRTGIAQGLWEHGGVDRPTADAMAARWIADDWTPQSEAAFARTIERGVVDDLVRPPAVGALAEVAGVGWDEAAALLDRPSTDFTRFLAQPAINRRAREELNLILAGSFAFAGLSEEQVRDVALREPLRPVWRDAWARDIYAPLIGGLERTVLQSRLIGRTSDYANADGTPAGFLRHLRQNGAREPSARCYRAGWEAYYAAMLPTLGLKLSILGLLLHAYKLALFVLKLANLARWARWPMAAGAPLALLLLPILDPPPIVRTPLARNLFVSAGTFLPWMVSAQAKYQNLSYRAYTAFSDDKDVWDLSGLADPFEVAQQQTATEKGLEDDPRFQRLKARWPALAADQTGSREVADFRHMLDNQFLCDTGKDG